MSRRLEVERRRSASKRSIRCCRLRTVRLAQHDQTLARVVRRITAQSQPELPLISMTCLGSYPWRANIRKEMVQRKCVRAVMRQRSSKEGISSAASGIRSSLALATYYGMLAACQTSPYQRTRCALESAKAFFREAQSLHQSGIAGSSFQAKTVKAKSTVLLLQQRCAGQVHLSQRP